MKKEVKIKFQNGINYQIAVNEILNELVDEYEFIESENPDFIVFGPYGNDVPGPGDYTRIGYFCENMKPDFSVCEWALGIPREEEIGHRNYKRIQWHGLNPHSLIKSDAEQHSIKKKRFCNFLYSHQVPYREEFFKQLSKYKKVDAPGRSMNNMPSIDINETGDIWTRKKNFLSEYKFTIAFENYSYPGYQTEKLYDAMLANSIPIYCGDPNIEEIFNTKSFINAPEYLCINNSPWLKAIERSAQPDFEDIRPMYFQKFHHKVKRKTKSWMKDLKMRLQFNKLDFAPLIDRIVEIDRNPELYQSILQEPWLKGNNIPEDLSTKAYWRRIFEVNESTTLAGS